MEIIKDEDIHLKFLLGLPVNVDGLGNFNAPLLTNIVDMTEEIYNMSISTLFFDKKQLQQDGLEQYSSFEVLSSIILSDVSYRTLFFYGLNLHFNEEITINQDGEIYFGEYRMDSILTEEKFEYIKKLVRIANNLAQPKKEDEYAAGNDEARKFIEKLKQKNERLKDKVKDSINLHSIISAIGWKSQNFKFINELNIYQIYDGLDRLNVIDNYNYTMFGIYNGKIDGSKIKLPEISWVNIINKK